MMDFSYDILDLLKKYEGDTGAALEGEQDPKCLYAFSPLRENLFEWVELEPGSRVLQLGSDYGSYTGILLERAGEVVVLDPRDENLEVNRLRHGGRANVRYVRGDVRESGSCRAYKAAERERAAAASQAADAGQAAAVSRAADAGQSAAASQAAAAGQSMETGMELPFDYVVTAGFLELFRKEEAAAILEAAAGFLKPGGTLLAAAENSAGVRYWMGAAPFETAFLEVEYRSLFEELRKSWGGSFTMYYPVPDYRYPATVYSDQYLPKTGDVTNISARLDGPGFWFGSEEEAMTKACQNGEFTKFANSFLGVWIKGKL